jgi:glyoxylase-like metal-dependent hydrolase (beta-lactamase superfamily II)
MIGRFLLLAAGAALTACNAQPQQSPSAADGNSADSTTPAALSLTRLDCGTAEFKDMNSFFSDRPGVYPPGPGKVTDSCYLIRHGDQEMVWDTGLPAETKDKPMNENGMVAQIDRPLVDQLKQLGLAPGDIDVVGISHVHGDHIGQAAQFTAARLVVGRGDFDWLKGRPEDTLKGWRAAGKQVNLVTADTDVFGDGTVIAIHLPGHTPDHLGLLVKLKSGPVLLTGDLYHTTIARQKRSQPSWNDDKDKELASMDKFEALAKQTGAKVIIQHEPNDIGKLPAFPQAAE